MNELIDGLANPKEEEQRECINPACKEKFVPKRPWQKFHSRDCQESYWRVFSKLARERMHGEISQNA